MTQPVDTFLASPRPTGERSSSPASSDGTRTVRRVLVTGCGRSGTTYASHLLTSCGLDVPHEHGVGRDGISSWLFAADATEVPWGPAPSAYRFEHVVHLVRDPLGSIPSFATLKRSAWAYIGRHVAIDPRESLLVHAAAYWLRWNALIEARASLRVRVEVLPESLGLLSNHLGVALDSSATARIPRDLNTRRYGRLLGSLEARCPGFARVRHGRVVGAVLARVPRAYGPIGWADLHALAPALAPEVHAKALEYGYCYTES